MTDVVEIDGSRGEGGGQILRSALSLSALTGRPLHLVNIRAGRRRPGLMPQHLRAVEAAAAISAARTVGVFPGSREIDFFPGHLTAGDYRFDIGTAGSAPLVLQTVYLPLAAAGGSSTVTIRGGTHVPFSPAFDFLQRHWLDFLRRCGFTMELALPVAGFYPRGGGELRARIGPLPTILPLRLPERGNLLRIRCLSLAANLPRTIAERQSRRAQERLAAYRHHLEMETGLLPAAGKGTVLLLQAQFDHSAACYVALGERGKPAEQVADEAADALLAFLGTDAAIDEHLADQLVLPLALASGESVLRASRVSPHLLTNLQVVSQFVPARVVVTGTVDAPGTVHIHGVPLAEIRSRHLHTGPDPPNLSPRSLPCRKS